MSQKTPSENSKDLEESQGEFSGLFQNAARKAGYLIKEYPKLVFISMVFLIILSGLASFLGPLDNQFDQSPEDLEERFPEGAGTTSTELGLLLDLGGRAKRLYALQGEIEGLLSKDTLNQEDSLFLEKALEELEYFENHKPKADEDQME
jgi:hypothetical protein